ncbi:Maturation and nuclear export of 40S ribosomal subunits interacting protein [Vanrija albida]|uniref:Maturation and nuclear export of 40S ribosomal subunits interacting protein n=1 Tax=Vanrija albida TaxID=181172 RepID=A0ABR3Q0W4_9TREE
MARTQSPLDQIKALERQLTDTPANPNPLLALLQLARHADPEVVHRAAWALYRVFGLLLAQGRVGGITGAGDASAAAVPSEGGGGGGGAREVKAWVRDRLLEYVGVLGGLLSDSEASLRTSALSLLFALLPPLSDAAGVPLHQPYFRLLVRALLFPAPSQRGVAGPSKRAVAANQAGAGVSPDVAAAAVDDYWAKYDDLRLFFFREVAALVAAGGVSPDNVLAQVFPLTNLPKVAEDLNAFFLPSLATPPEAGKKAKKAKTKKGKKDVEALPDWMATYESEDEEEEAVAGGKRQRTTALGTAKAVHSVQAHTAAYTACWEAILSHLALDDMWTRRILAGLHGERGMLAHLSPSRRVRIADWLGGTVDAGGAHAMLAMNGLFVLMTAYNLDYPLFYDRLYALLDGEVLHARYRARFFRLLDTFLRSPLLSAALVASFIKRLSRLALAAPPAGAILAIPFVYNLFKRHPGTMAMLQRLPEDMEDGDPYDERETAPIATRALDSSAWELAALQNHYLASVATLAKIFAEQFTKPEFNLEDFLDHGYATLFDTEAARKLKNPPALAVALELGQPADLPPLFPKAADAGERDAVSQLWAF